MFMSVASVERSHMKALTKPISEKTSGHGNQGLAQLLPNIVAPHRGLCERLLHGPWKVTFIQILGKCSSR
ncbi:hypothetical protein RIF29_18242 [Crotalaria pallida]|uniref:Uncharacterized protein n=1 Tax=Crotalaria pallida TaxID=3830 RepID=A0AAN9FIJ4_CROPI